MKVWSAITFVDFKGDELREIPPRSAKTQTQLPKLGLKGIGIAEGLHEFKDPTEEMNFGRSEKLKN